MTEGALGEPLARKPHDALVPADSLPFQPMSEAVTVVVPLVVAFQDEESADPDGKAQFSLQPLIAEGPAVTLT